MTRVRISFRFAEKVVSALRPHVESILVTAAFLLGAVTVPVGVALVYVPAGVILGGLLVLAGALLYAKGRL